VPVLPAPLHARSQPLPSQLCISRVRALEPPKTLGNKFSPKEISPAMAPDYLLIQEVVLKYLKCMGHTFWET